MRLAQIKKQNVKLQQSQLIQNLFLSMKLLGTRRLEGHQKGHDKVTRMLKRHRQVSTTQSCMLTHSLFTFGSVNVVLFSLIS